MSQLQLIIICQVGQCKSSCCNFYEGVLLLYLPVIHLNDDCIYHRHIILYAYGIYNYMLKPESVEGKTRKMWIKISNFMVKKNQLIVNT